MPSIFDVPASSVGLLGGPLGNPGLPFLGGPGYNTDFGAAEEGSDGRQPYPVSIYDQNGNFVRTISGDDAVPAGFRVGPYVAPGTTPTNIGSYIPNNGDGNAVGGVPAQPVQGGNGLLGGPTSAIGPNATSTATPTGNGGIGVGLPLLGAITLGAGGLAASGSTPPQPGNGDIRATTIPLVPPLGGGGTTATGPASRNNALPFVPNPPTTIPNTTGVPPNRDLYTEGLNATNAYGALGPGIFNNYNTNNGLYSQSDLANYQGLLGGVAGANASLTPYANAQTVASNNALRGGNVADLQQFGPQMLALLQQLNPQMYASLTAANQQAVAVGPNQYQNSLGAAFGQGPQFQGSGLGGDLTRMAQEQLALGSGLSDQQKRDAEQAAREGWSARGLVNSPGAVAEEVLNKDRYGQQLLAQRQQFASGVNQLEQGQGALNLSALGQNYGLGSNLASMDYARQQQNFGNAFSNAQLQTGAAYNPTSSIFGTQTSNVGLNQNLANQGLGLAAGQYSNPYVQQQFNPFNSAAQDVFSTNYNAGNDRFIAAGNNAAGLAAGQNTSQAYLARNFLNTLGGLIGS